VREWLVTATEAAALAINAVALIFTLVGTAIALYGAVQLIVAPTGARDPRAVWLNYARWLVAALTFQLAADIVESSIATSWEAVGRLAAIALIRTFLNYFLERDVKEAQERRESGRQLKLTGTS
jgi:uncharacterized membrane protein